MRTAMRTSPIPAAATCLVLLALLLSAAIGPGALWGAEDELAVAREIISLEHDQAESVAAWQREKDDLERLIQTRSISLAAKQERLAELKRQLEARSAEEAARAVTAKALHADQAAVATALASLCRTWPQLAPPQEGATAVEALRSVGAALDKLLAQSSRWDVTVVEGRLPDGSTTAAQVLSAGLAASWYLRLDGHGAGVAKHQDGHWLLTPSSEAQAVAAISAAIAQLRGNAVPEPILLPQP